MRFADKEQARKEPNYQSKESPGTYFINVSVVKLEEFYNLLGEESLESDEPHVVKMGKWLFANALCDENGDAYEEAADPELVKEVKVRTINRLISEFITYSAGADLGNE